MWVFIYVTDIGTLLSNRSEADDKAAPVQQVDSNGRICFSVSLCACEECKQKKGRLIFNTLNAQ